MTKAPTLIILVRIIDIQPGIIAKDHCEPENKSALIFDILVIARDLLVPLYTIWHVVFLVKTLGYQWFREIASSSPLLEAERI